MKKRMFDVLRAVRRRMKNVRRTVRDRFDRWDRTTVEGVSIWRMVRGLVIVGIVSMCWNVGALRRFFHPPAMAMDTGEIKFHYPHTDSQFVRKSDLTDYLVFKEWLDSLRADSVGGQIYDSILSANPGLKDPVGIMRDLYIK